MLRGEEPGGMSCSAGSKEIDQLTLFAPLITAYTFGIISCRMNRNAENRLNRYIQDYFKRKKYSMEGLARNIPAFRAFF